MYSIQCCHVCCEKVKTVVEVYIRILVFYQWSPSYKETWSKKDVNDEDRNNKVVIQTTSHHKKWNIIIRNTKQFRNMQNKNWLNIANITMTDGYSFVVVVNNIRICQHLKNSYNSERLLNREKYIPSGNFVKILLKMHISGYCTRHGH